MTQELTGAMLLAAYRAGYFPMAESRNATDIYWFYPEMRGIIPLEAFHVPKSLARRMKKEPFTLTTGRAFPAVIAACAQRPETWINDAIIRLYCELWEQGHAHSVECWQGETLAGGLYGVSIGGAFFGESMFSRAPDASKIALVHLAQLLKKSGYRLLDTQYVNEHLKQFGVVEIPREEYLKRLEEALQIHPKPCWK